MIIAAKLKLISHRGKSRAPKAPRWRFVCHQLMAPAVNSCHKELCPGYYNCARLLIDLKSVWASVLIRLCILFVLAVFKKQDNNVRTVLCMRVEGWVVLLLVYSFCAGEMHKLYNLVRILVNDRLKVQSCKLFNSKYMITSKQIANTLVFSSIAVLVFNLLSRKVLFIDSQNDRCEIFRILLKHVGDHLSVLFQFAWLHLLVNKWNNQWMTNE